MQGNVAMALENSSTEYTSLLALCNFTRVCNFSFNILYWKGICLSASHAIICLFVELEVVVFSVKTLWYDVEKGQ
jgi:hypothetical protein